MNVSQNIYNNFSNLSMPSAEAVKKSFWILEIPFDPIISLFTQCMADFLCLETLKHGTSLGNYLNIRVEGADPKHGGKIGGSSSFSNQKYMNSSEGYFHVFKDSGIVKLEFFPVEMQIKGDRVALNAFKREISKTSTDKSFFVSYIRIPLSTRIHATMSGWASDQQASTMAKVRSAMLAFFTPTINVRFIPEELDLFRYDRVKAISNDELAKQQYRFQEDEDYGGV
ncbi:MAG: hypothetical protein ACHQUC_09930, partial [Chlamydiales bacterium]